MAEAPPTASHQDGELPAGEPQEQAPPRRTIVDIAQVEKTYRVFSSPLERLKHASGVRARFLEVKALDDVSLQVRQGEALGVIGENGAGKSTLLKIVAGTSAPTRGSVLVQGTLTSILELGAGFHPEFSGRDNALLYGAMMGLSQSEMSSRLDSILEFAEIGEFMYQPVKTYSTGMLMRLAFAVATHVDAEILVVDEALAVGDGYFQKKCIDRILEMKEAGVTILFCSHALYHISMFCDRAVWLHGGRLQQEGSTTAVVDAYEAHLLHLGKRLIDSTGFSAEAGGSLAGTVGAKVGRVTRLEVNDFRGQGDYVMRPHDPMAITVGIDSIRPAEQYHLGFALNAPDGTCLVSISSQWDGHQPLAGSSSYLIRLTIPNLPVASGRYTLSAFLIDESGLHVHDQVAYGHTVVVENPNRWDPGLLDVERSWERL